MTGHALRGTYRLQLGGGFGLSEAENLADYLSELGVSHLYTSPLLQAAPGSEHGYDVVDHRTVNRELGGQAGHQRLVKALARRRLGLVVDIVPNHMGIASRENQLWWDVLTRGRSSPYAPYFDIHWDIQSPGLTGKILLPILADHYGLELEKGDLCLARAGDQVVVQYHDHQLPLSPETRAELNSESDELDRRIAAVNRDLERLDAILRRQHYRLAWWRLGSELLNYRRFFAIDTLVALHMDRQDVFDCAHKLPLEWLASAQADGLRVDHPDGLRDPQSYLQRLRNRAGDAWIVVEKILAPDEKLPADWPVAGTTGYDFLNQVSGLFVDLAARQPLTDLYVRFTGVKTNYAELARQNKLLLLTTEFAPDVARVGGLLAEVCEGHRRFRDYGPRTLQAAVAELAADFPVYRSYADPQTGQVSDQDLANIRQAVDHAKRHRADLDPRLFESLADLLTLRLTGPAEAEFVYRFQQLSGPAAAKGIEDTAFYRYNRLVSLNEVGGDPDRFGTPLETFHAWCRHMHQHWPRGMLTTSTHDTKRSEDVRARIHVLTEMVPAWDDAVSRWSAMNRQHRTGDWPDPNLEYLLYQNLVGAWPITVDRMTAFAAKAMREAKEHTDWKTPNQAYESAVLRFVTAAMESRDFREDLAAFVVHMTVPGWINALAQTLIKYTAPGVPDLYQGTELWDLSLVDPDNRRPVDYDLRRKLLRELANLSIDEIWTRADEGLPKLLVIQRALALRARRPEAFDKGPYHPIQAHGARREHVVAFTRGDEIAALVPRLTLRLAGRWDDTSIELPTGRWIDQFTNHEHRGGRRRVEDLLTRFPVALLSREGGN